MLRNRYRKKPFLNPFDKKKEEARAPLKSEGSFPDPLTPQLDISAKHSPPTLEPKQGLEGVIIKVSQCHTGDSVTLVTLPV